MRWALLLTLIGACLPSYAFKDKSIYLGAGYYSQNAFNKITKSDDAKPTMWGTTSYPLHVKYDLSIMQDWFFSPALYYSLIKRNAAGSSAEITMIHLTLPFGKNFSSGDSWDWSVGPGLMQYQMKGAGGIQQLNNGGSTANFALPGRTVTVRTVTSNAEIGYNQNSFRVGMALIIEGLLNNTKRTESFFINFNYRPQGF